MKTRTVMCLLFSVFIASFLIGCKTTPVAYSFAASETNAAHISFKDDDTPSVVFVSFDGQTLPKPESKTHWDPVTFPSGRELRIVVHANYQTTSKTTLSGFGLLGDVVNLAQDVRAVSRNVDADVLFICPPLAAGRDYLLTFSKEPGMPGRNLLTLTDVERGTVVVQQEFEVVFGGDSVR